MMGAPHAPPPATGQRPQGLAGRVDGVHVAHEIGKVDGPLAVDERHVVGARRLVELPSDRAVGAVGDRKGSCSPTRPQRARRAVLGEVSQLHQIGVEKLAR